MPTLTDEQRLDWLQLIRSDNVGPRTFALAAAPVRRCAQRDRSAPRHFPAAAAPRAPSASIRAPTPSARWQRPESSALSLSASAKTAYPQRLAEIDDAPPLLAVRGNLAALTRPMIAMVGSRNASAAGLKFAERIARELGEAGFVIASGLARGIDAAAHRASLATGTVAVLAGGHDHIYPEQHLDLLDADSARRCRDLGDAVRLGAPRAGLPAPQSADLRACRSVS